MTGRTAAVSQHANIVGEWALYDIQERAARDEALGGVLHHISCQIRAVGESISVTHCTVYQRSKRQRLLHRALPIDEDKSSWSKTAMCLEERKYHLINFSAVCRKGLAACHIRQHMNVTLGAARRALAACLAVFPLLSTDNSCHLSFAKAQYHTSPRLVRYLMIYQIDVNGMSIHLPVNHHVTHFVAMFFLTCIADPLDAGSRPIAMWQTAMQGTCSRVRLCFAYTARYPSSTRKSSRARGTVVGQNLEVS